METAADKLRADIERYRKLLNSIADQAAIEAIELMIAEKERRVLGTIVPSKDG
jgi:hypothetical protein